MRVSIDKHLAAIPSASTDSRAQMRSNAERWLVGGTDAQREAAQRLIDALDQQEEAETVEAGGRR